MSFQFCFYALCTCIDGDSVVCENWRLGGDFIYLRDSEGERERDRGEGEKQTLLLRREPDRGLDPGTPGS